MFCNQMNTFARLIILSLVLVFLHRVTCIKRKTVIAFISNATNDPEMTHILLSLKDHLMKTLLAVRFLDYLEVLTQDLAEEILFFESSFFLQTV